MRLIRIRKSQIGVEFSYSARESIPNLIVIWIHASTPSRFEQGYRDFARKAKLSGREEHKSNPLEIVCEWLSDEANGRWLMVLDNVDNDADWFLPRPTVDNDGQPHRPLDYFLPKTSNGTIIITSRNQTVARNMIGDYGKPFYVARLQEPDALSLLRAKVGVSDDEKEDARALVYALECIPLAITQCAAYIQSRERFNITKYLQLFEESEDNMAQLLNNEDAKDHRRDHSSRVPIIKTWQITFNQVRETKPKAAELLALMSVFDGREIPRCLLEHATAKSSLEFEDAIAPLLSYSLIHQQTKGDDFGMHRLVQIAVRRWLELNDERPKWNSSALDIMARTFPDGMFESWALCQTLLPHGKELMALDISQGSPMDALNRATFRQNSGWYFLQVGEYKVSEESVDEALLTRERLLGPEHLLTLQSRSALASILRVQGQLDKAEPLIRGAFEGMAKTLGMDHLETVNSRYKLALLLARKGDYVQAEDMYRCALERKLQLLGPEHRDCLFIAANLASTLRQQRKFDEAEPLLRETVGKMETVLGKEHPDRVIYLTNLALLLEDQQKYAETESIQRQTLKLRQKILGPSHPRTLANAGGLARVLLKQGKTEEAAPLIPLGLEAQRKGYNEIHE